MKSFRLTLVIVFVIAGLIAFTVWDTKRSEKAQDATEKAKAVVRIPTEAITRIEMITRVSDTTLEKRDGQWQVQGADLKDRADDSAVQSFISSLGSEQTLQKVAPEEGSDVNLATFGLDQPVARVKISGEGQPPEEIKLGSVKAYDSNLYAQIGDEKIVWLVGSAWDSYAAKRVNDLRDKRLMRQELKDPTRIEIRAAGAPPLELAKNEKGWRVVKGGEDFPVAAAKVDSYLDQLRNARAMDFLGSAEKLDKTDLEIRLSTQAKEGAFDVRFSPASAAKGKPNPKLPAPPEMVRAASGDLRELTDLAKQSVDPLRKSAQDFYDLQLPFRFVGAEKDIAKIKIDAPGLATGEFVKKGEDWASADPGLQTSVDSTKLKNVVTKLSQLEAAAVLDRAKAGAAKLKNRITLAKATGETIFEMSWGERGPGAANAPATVTAKTNLTNEPIAVREADLKALDLAGAVKPPANPTPAPSPPPKAK